MPEIYMIFIIKIFYPIFFWGGAARRRILLPVVSYAYKFCVPPAPLGLYFLCRLRFAQGRAGLRHVRGVRPNRAAKFRGAAISDLTKINLQV